jgi:hypothetical protein
MVSNLYDGLQSGLVGLPDCLAAVTADEQRCHVGVRLVEYLDQHRFSTAVELDMC